MSRRVWTGILAGLLAATVVLTVAGAAFRAGERREVVTRTVEDGEVVRVVDDHGWGWGYGPGPGIFLIPLLGIALIVVLVRGGRRGGWGPGGWGYGGPWHGGARPEATFQEWHRKAHEEPADRTG